MRAGAHRAAWRANFGLRFSPLAVGQAAGCGTANRPLGTASSVAESDVPRFPCGAVLAAAAPRARCRNAANAARAAAAGLVASDEMWDRFAAHVVADRAALRDNGSAIGRSDDLGPAAGMVAARRIVVAAGAQPDSYAAPDNSFAAAAGNSSPVSIHNSAADVIDSCAAQNNCVPAGAGIGVRGGWISVVAVVLDVPVANGWVPGEKDAAENPRDDSARGMAPLPKPAS